MKDVESYREMWWSNEKMADSSKNWWDFHKSNFWRNHIKWKDWGL